MAQTTNAQQPTARTNQTTQTPKAGGPTTSAPTTASSLRTSVRGMSYPDGAQTLSTRSSSPAPSGGDKVKGHTTTALNVRATPSSKGALLGQIAAGGEVEIVDRKSSVPWLGITYQGKGAYVHGAYVKIDEAQASAPQTSTTSQAPSQQAPGQAGGSVSGVVDGLVAGAKNLYESGKQWLTDLITPDTQAEAGPDQKPVEGTPALADPATAAPEKKDPAYESQRDNTYNKGGVSADNMCNVTTLAMQLETLAGSKRTAIEAALRLLGKDPAAMKEEEIAPLQLEDLLMQKFEALGDAWFEAKFSWIKGSGIPTNQWSCCLNAVAELFTDIVKSTEHNEATAGAKVTLGGKEVAKTEETLYSQQYFQEILKTELSNGAAVMLSTKLTGGHIVMLTQVLDDGIVINDPYGMRLTNGYVKNGAANDKALRGRLTAETADIDVRLRENADLRATLTAWTETSGTNMPQNMGEKNFYTWAQVTTWKIGKWNNIVRGS